MIIRSGETSSLKKDYCVFRWKDGKTPENITDEIILPDLLNGECEPVCVVMRNEVVYKAKK